MAIEVPGFLDATRKAAADLSTKQYYIVKLDTSGNVALCNGTTDIPYGVLQDKPNAAGVGCVVMCFGISKVSMAAGNTIGDQIGTDANGQAAVYVAGTDTTKRLIGQVLEDADAANGIGSIAFNCLGAARGA